MDFQRMDPYLLHGQMEPQDEKSPVPEPYGRASLEVGRSPRNGSGSVQEDFSPRHIPQESLIRCDSTILNNNFQFLASDTQFSYSASGPYVFGSHSPYQGYASCPGPRHRYPDGSEVCLRNNPHPGSACTEYLEYKSFPQSENNTYCEACFHLGSPPCHSHISVYGAVAPVNVAGDSYSQIPSEGPYDVPGSSSFPASAMGLDPSTNGAEDLGLLSSVAMQRDKKLTNPHPPHDYSGSPSRMFLGQSGTPGNINAAESGSDLISQSLFPGETTPPGGTFYQKVNLVFGESTLPHRPI